MKVIIRYQQVLLSIFFVIALFAFWYVGYPYVLSYQEQLQMFLFDSDYFLERVVVPGGVVRYLGEFFTQFGFSAFWGSVVVALLLGLIQVLAWAVSRARCKDGNLYLLTFLPSVLMLVFMGDENYRLTFLLSCILALVAMMLYPFGRRSAVRIPLAVVLTTVLYWMAGPAVFILALYVMAREIHQLRNYVRAFLPLFVALLILFASSLFAPYPLYRLFLGIGSYGVRDMLPLIQMGIMLLLVIVPVVREMMAGVESVMVKRLSVVCEVAILAGILVVGMPMTFEKAKMEVVEYDAMMRHQDWDGIIRKAEKRSPDNPLTVSALNLALAMKGQQNERAFQFYQNGWEGAFPKFNKHYETSFFLADLFFYVGMVNMTQVFAFEANEDIPDNNKSSRMMKRLAETNLINGQYEVARKYLDMLGKTLYYSKWAKATGTLLGDEDAIDHHSVYGYLRKVRLTDDFLYSEQETDKIMGQLLMHNPDNYVAAQYLLLLPKLEGNRQKYMMYLNYLKSLKNKK